VQRYRCFGDWTSLELRPLTLLYGRNNAGKSALLRTLPILARSTGAGALSPWELGNADGPGQGASFTDALWRGRKLKTMGLKLRWQTPEGTLTDRFLLRYIDELPGVVVSEIELRDSTNAVTFEAKAKPYPDHETFVLADDREWLPGFRGLAPTSATSDPGHGPLLIALSERLSSLNAGVQWLTSIRSAPKLLITPADGRQTMMSPRGEEAAGIVVSNEGILASVREFYSGKEIGRDLRVDSVGSDRYRLVLDTPGYLEWGIPLTDVGAGMGQVLPVLVAAAFAREFGGSRIVAIEDPEAHLHENARRALAEHLVEIVRDDADPPRFVLETHSRTFLLAIQLAVAQGKLPPDHVRIYWLDPQPDGSAIPLAVDLNEHGRPTSVALQAVLDEDQRLATELLELHLSSGAI
jgi:hypothetical protein